jgi:HAE1 family hydrophobic/amphiphilic exporter-1
MSLSELSINRQVFAWMLMFGLIIFGGICFQRMGISQMPDVNFPVVNIALTLDNAAPEFIETDVVDVIEDAVMGIEGLKSVVSTSSQGTANITCEFDLNRNIDVAMQEVQTRIAQASKQLPTKLYPPVVTKTNPEDQPILWVMVTADKAPISEQMIYARNTLKNQLSTISGVGNIVFGGYVAPNLRIWVDEKKLHEFDLTASDITAAIQAEQLEQPAGRIENTIKEFNVRVLGEAKTPLEFSKIRINQRAGAPNYNPMPLSRVAKVEEGIADLRAISRYNGKTSVGLGIVKQHGSNAVEVSKLIYAKLEQMRSTLLPGYRLDVRLDTTKYIRESVAELNFTLLLSALLTSLVCYLFLGSWSSTINVLFAIPTSIVGAFIVLYFMGFTLNTFTLLGLSLAIGIVVDDAIMMLENIVRHFEMGKSRRQAAIDGSNEITFAALAATIAIAAIFVPVIFMRGIVGKFFFQYGVTVTVAVMLSLLEALTLTPMRCSEFLHSAKLSTSGWVLRIMDAFMDWLSHHYTKRLKYVLNHRIPVIFFSTIFFIGSMAVLIPMRKELIPQQDQSLFLLNIKTPVGTSIWATDALFKKVEAYLVTQPEVKDAYSTVGNYQGNDIVNAGVIYVTLVDPSHRRASQREVMDRVRISLTEKFPGIDFFNQDLSLAGFSATRGYPIEFIVEGPDYAKVADCTNTLIERLKKTGLYTDFNSDYQNGMPEIRVIPDRDRAADRGVLISAMGSEISTLIGGFKFDANTQYPKDGHRYDIRVRLEPDQYANPSALNQIFVRNDRGATGELVRLNAASRVEVGQSLQLISRRNRMRAIPVYANVVAGQSQQKALDALDSVSKEVLPPGYRAVITGSAQAFRDAFSNLIFALILGILVSYMVLASQFNSFIHPLTVLIALPFSLSGAFLALFAMHQSLNLFSMIGLILLMGIVKKNSILLVDFTNHRRSEGLSPDQALLEACPVRLRPILMTSVATMAGALPEALSLGPGSETMVPMAISIIGGVFVSTLLTLFVVPCVYSLFSRLERPDIEEAAAA